MISTNKFDSTGKEIFVGDHILKTWGWFKYQGRDYTEYMIHTVRRVPVHKLAHGGMCDSDDDHGNIFILGNSYNLWEGKEVTKLSNEEYEKKGTIPDDIRFAYNENQEPFTVTDQHFLDLTEEQWTTELFLRRKRYNEFLFGKEIKC